MRAQDALRFAVARLTQAGIPDAARDARHLLAFAMGLAPDRLTLHLPDDLSPDAQTRLEAALIARAARQPVAQIIGHRLFWGRPFRVTCDTLDPRPETETLIALALTAPFTHPLDLGTGTGAILLTLLAERPDASGLATDISPAALIVAEGNAAALGLTHRARFQTSDWFAGIDGQFDLILSNPPYIAAAEMPHLSRDVREWEPHLALTPGGDGLAPYRAIAAAAPRHLTPLGRLMVETGPTQGHAVAALFVAAGLRRVTIHPDMDGRDRVVCAYHT